MNKLFSFQNILSINHICILITLMCCMVILLSTVLFTSKNYSTLICTSSISSSIFSLYYLIMDAPDVAMTEVALNAALSTLVLLTISKKYGSIYSNNLNKKKMIISAISCILFAMIMFLAVSDLPYFGSIESNSYKNTSMYYINNTAKEIGIPSFVAAILASYRGYDTLGETVVILIGGLGVLLVMSNKKR